MEVTVTYDHIHGDIHLECPFGGQQITQIQRATFGCSNGFGAAEDSSSTVADSCLHQSTCAFDSSSFGELDCSDDTAGVLYVNYICEYTDALTTLDGAAPAGFTFKHFSKDLSGIHLSSEASHAGVSSAPPSNVVTSYRTPIIASVVSAAVVFVGLAAYAAIKCNKRDSYEPIASSE